MHCVFCEIIAQKRPGYIIADYDDAIVFVSLEGHPIVATKKHIPDIFGLDDKIAAKVMIIAREVARATKEGLAADGIYVTQTNGLAAGQSVFHYHMHLYPKWSDGRQMGRDDGLRKRTMEKIGALLQAQV